MNMSKFYIFVVMLLCSLTSVAQTRFVGADNDNIRYMGRVNFANRFAPMMAYPGTTITACFTGSSIAVQMKPGSGYFMVGVDHKNYHKIHFGERDSVIRIASELPEGRHIIELMLVSEEYQSQAEFYGFVIDDDAQLVDMGKDNRPLIEFIGDSMTCGYGTEAADGSVKYDPSNSNFFYTSAPIINNHVVSQQPLKPVFPVTNTFFLLYTLLNAIRNKSINNYHIFQGAFPEFHKFSKCCFSRKVSIHCQKPR